MGNKILELANGQCLYGADMVLTVFRAVISGKGDEEKKNTNAQNNNWKEKNANTNIFLDNIQAW